MSVRWSVHIIVSLSRPLTHTLVCLYTAWAGDAASSRRWPAFYKWPLLYYLHSLSGKTAQVTILPLITGVTTTVSTDQFQENNFGDLLFASSKVTPIPYHKCKIGILQGHPLAYSTLALSFVQHSVYNYSTLM